LEVTVDRVIVFNAHFHRFVVNLNHSEVLFHFFFQNGVVKNCDARCVKGRNSVLASTPFYCLDIWPLAFYGCACLPAFWIVRGVHSDWFTAPHHDITVFCTASEHFVLWVIVDRVNLILVQDSLKRGFGQSENVVLIRLYIEHTDHIFTWNCCHQALTSPDCA
jgi:hypothetical protein